MRLRAASAHGQCPAPIYGDVRLCAAVAIARIGVEGDTDEPAARARSSASPHAISGHKLPIYRGARRRRRARGTTRTPGFFGRRPRGRLGSRTLKGGHRPRVRPTQPGAQRPRWCALPPWEELRSSFLMSGPWPGHPSAATASSVALGGWPARARRPLRCWRARGLISILRNHQDESSEARITRRRGRKRAACVTTSSADTTCERVGGAPRSADLLWKEEHFRTVANQQQQQQHHCLCVQLLHCIDTAQHASDAALAASLRHA